MSVHIAIPEPTSSDPAYNQRSFPPYLAALHSAGATPIVIPLHERQDRVARLLAGVQGILLPGSRYDVDPQRYGEDPTPECADPDAARTAVDELLLQDAFNLHKPFLAICHGAQTLNVWRNGSLIQDLKTLVDHRPVGRGGGASGSCRGRVEVGQVGPREEKRASRRSIRATIRPFECQATISW